MFLTSRLKDVPSRYLQCLWDTGDAQMGPLYEIRSVFFGIIVTFFVCIASINDWVQMYREDTVIESHIYCVSRSSRPDWLITLTLQSVLFSLFVFLLATCVVLSE